jgi:RNA polymerase-binding protein DksA
MPNATHGEIRKKCSDALERKRYKPMKNERPFKGVKTFENLLRSRLAELKNHVDQLRRELVVDDEVDDEVTQASRSSNREFVIATMEREIRNISEIEQALDRIAKKEYGICVTCERAIPGNRLQAIPWTRRCVDCAGGGINGNNNRAFGQPAFGSSPG